MIVNYTSQGWEIITQRAHGLLAAQVAMQWKVKERPERWTETLVAIADHDDAQLELEADDLITPQGGPMNFAMKTFEADHCRRLLDLALSKSRYIALLGSLHITFLHYKEAKTNPEARTFLKEQEKLQNQWQKELKLTKAEADKIYSLLEWCDAFSLLLCQHEIQPENRLIEVSQGPAKKQHQLMQNKNGSLTVKPWPFESKSFDLHVECRVIPKLQFTNSADFKKEFLKAAVEEKIWKIEK